MQQRNTTIDIAKLIAAFLVVGIHTNLFGDVNEQVQLLFTGLLCRMGVPFFALCSGYYLAEKKSIMLQWMKLIKLYALWAVLYLAWLQPNWIDTGHASPGAYIGYMKSAVLTGAYFHLWYVLYVIYAIPTYWLCKRYIPHRWWLPIAAMLYGMNALQYGYSAWLPSYVLTPLHAIDCFYAITNAQFVLLPMLLTGGYIKKRGIPTKNNSIIALSISAALLIAEAEFLNAHGNNAVSYIFMILPTATAIFCLLQNIRIKRFPIRHCGSLSLIVYCIHPMFCQWADAAIPSTILAWLVVCAISLSISYAYITIKEKNVFPLISQMREKIIRVNPCNLRDRSNSR